MSAASLCSEAPCRKDHQASVLGFEHLPMDRLCDLISVACHLILLLAHLMTFLCYSTSSALRYSVFLRMIPFHASNDQAVFIAKIGQLFYICQDLEGGEQVAKCHLKTRFAQAR